MRLVFCDENRILSEALAAAMEARGHKVLEIASTIAGGLAAVAAHQPDLLVLDPGLPGGADCLSAGSVRQHSPGTAVLVLSSLTDPGLWTAAMKAGAAGLLRKDQNVSQVGEALDVISRGGVVFSPALPGQLSAHTRKRRRHPPYLLTPREREVLTRIVAGQSTCQMAAEMHIATSTLRSYVKNVLIKLGTHSRLQAAALAMREDLLGDLSA